MDKFNNKYRIPSARARWWDYSGAGAYFITICTAHRIPFFGEIIKARLQSTELAFLAEKIWHEIPNQFIFIELGSFVVMPDHIHMILVINDDAIVETRLIASLTPDQPIPQSNDQTRLIASLTPDQPIPQSNDQTRLIASLTPDQPIPQSNDQTRLIASLQPRQKTGGVTGQKNPMLNRNIARVIRWYKGRCAFEMRKIHAEFGWQSRFYDHIIRNDDEYLRICHYIETNPENWEKDTLSRGQ